MSGFRMSGFRMSGFRMSGFRMSGFRMQMRFSRDEPNIQIVSDTSFSPL